MDEFSQITINGEFLNLIPSRFPPIDIYARIANGRDEEFANLEALTNPRLKQQKRELGTHINVDNLPAKYQNWNHAPFAYQNPEGSTFLRPIYQGLELSSDLQTALVEAVDRRQSFLSRTNESRTELDMRVLTRSVEGSFVDGTKWPDNLTEDERWELGDQVLKVGADGVIFRSLIRPMGIRLGILNAGILGRAVQGDHYRFRWDGNRISSIYAFTNAQTIDPAILRVEEAVLAA